MQIIKKIIELIGENCITIIMPISVYLISFVYIDYPISQVLLLPEWMFFSITLLADNIVTILNKAKTESSRINMNYDSFREQAIIYFILGIVICSFFLAFSIVGNYSDLQKLPSYFGKLQLSVFLSIFIASLIWKTCWAMIFKVTTKE